MDLDVSGSWYSFIKRLFAGFCQQKNGRSKQFQVSTHVLVEKQIVRKFPLKNVYLLYTLRKFKKILLFVEHKKISNIKKNFNVEQKLVIIQETANQTFVKFCKTSQDPQNQLIRWFKIIYLCKAFFHFIWITLFTQYSKHSLFVFFFLNLQYIIRLIYFTRCTDLMKVEEFRQVWGSRAKSVGRMT